MKKRLLCLLLSVVMLLSLSACGKDNSIGQLADQLGVPQNEQQPEPPAEGAAAVPEQQAVSDGANVLPEQLINFFMVSGVYQVTQVSDYSVEQAMDYEQNNAMTIGYDVFSNHSGTYETPVYTVSTSYGYDQLVRYGIQPDGLRALYGDQAKVVTVVVSDAAGQYVTVFYWVADDVLIAFGKGMHVFTYKPVEALG